MKISAGDSGLPQRAIYPQLRARRNASGDEVAAHQKARLRSAMIEACARNGYEATTGRDVIRLAGVSTKTIYKHFGGRQGCFLNFLEQSHIRTVCSRVEFNTTPRACPAGSVYGWARAWSPLLEAPIEGPVYLRSNGGERALPDLVAALRGPASQPVEIDLVGYLDSVHARLRTTFALVPDAPVSRFVLEMRGGRKGLLVNSEDLCRAGSPRRTASVQTVGQNNKRADRFPVVANRCPKSKRGRGGGRP